MVEKKFIRGLNSRGGGLDNITIALVHNESEDVE